MRHFRIVELDDNWQPQIETHWTSQDVLNFYWEHWSTMLQEADPEFYNSKTLDHLKEQCINQWADINWAEEMENNDEN